MTSRDQHFRKPDPVVLVFCILTLISCLGAAGRQGRMRAKEMVCLFNLGQWGAYFQGYIDDHDGRFNPGWEVGETELWMNALRPYYRDRWPLLLCPTATRAAGPGTERSTFTAWSRTVDLPEGAVHCYVSSYGINSWTNAMTRDRASHPEDWFWKTTRGIANPDRVPVFGDATWHDAWPHASDAPTLVPIDSARDEVASEMSHFCIDRHNGTVNVLFMDWSARPVGLKELWRLKWHRSYDTYGPWTRAGGVWTTDWPQWMREFKDY